MDEIQGGGRWWSVGFTGELGLDADTPAAGTDRQQHVQPHHPEQGQEDPRPKGHSELRRAEELPGYGQEHQIDDGCHDIGAVMPPNNA